MVAILVFSHQIFVVSVPKHKWGFPTRDNPKKSLEVTVVDRVESSYCLSKEHEVRLFLSVGYIYFFDECELVAATNVLYKLYIIL